MPLWKPESECPHPDGELSGEAVSSLALNASQLKRLLAYSDHRNHPKLWSRRLRAVQVYMALAAPLLDHRLIPEPLVE